MVLYPIERDGPTAGMMPAWEAIELKQRAPAEDWWLVAQPDHAALSGELARLLEAPAPDFLAAWRGSIAVAERNSAIGGMMVSGHFCRIARTGPGSADQSL